MNTARAFRLPMLASTLLLAGYATGAGAQNLVPNPDFDTDLAGWTIVLPSDVTLDNSVGSPAAPSMHMLAVDATPAATAYTDCIEIDTSSNVDLIADIRLITGAASASVTAYSSAGCTGPIGPAGLISDGEPLVDGWERAAAINYALPVGTVGVRVFLSVNGDLAEANFDRVRFGPTGTTPVSLQSFRVD